MYSKEENRILNQEFWESFGKYTRFYSIKIGMPITWMLYKTKIKGLELKFEVQKKWVSVILEINHRNEEQRKKIYYKLLDYQSFIDEGFEGKLIWEYDVLLKEGKSVSRIFIGTMQYNYLNREHWKDIFEFMAVNMYNLQNNAIEIFPILEEFLKANEPPE
jgi:hypothetical protein